MPIAAALKAIQAVLAIIRDIVRNDGKTLATIAVGVISLFFALLVLIIMPVVIHERIPVTVTKEQAVWYWQAAKNVTEMTQSPCDSGVYVDWQNVIAIDAVRLKQNFKKSSTNRAYKLAVMFVEEVGTCTYRTGEGDDAVCTDYPTYRLKTIDEVMAELKMSEKQQQAVKEKYLAIRYDFLIGFKSQSVAGAYDALYSGDMKWPVPSCHDVSSTYGMRTHPTKGDYRMHYGIDIPVPEGTIIQSPADGMVKSYEWSDAVGWTMVIDHGINERGERITTRYCHLSDKTVRAGQVVRAGDSIAKAGNTGYLTTGAHLHFEVYVNGVTVDPAEFFQPR